MQTLLKITIATVLTILAVVGLYGTVVLVSTSLDKSEVVECLKLESYSRQFTGFYLTKWQDSMCNAHNIVIDAPVQ